MARLTTRVVVLDPSNTLVVLHDGDELPAWAVGLVGDHCVTGDLPEPEPLPVVEGEPVAVRRPVKRGATRKEW